MKDKQVRFHIDIGSNMWIQDLTYESLILQAVAQSQL